MLKKLLFIFLLVQSVLQAQSLAGNWRGIVWQDNSADTFRYQLQLAQDQTAISGRAISTSKDGKIEAEFVVSGRWADGVLLMQEVEQLRPASPQWCLKYLEIRWEPHQSGGLLTGQWTATGCQPGYLRMHSSGPIGSELMAVEPIMSEALIMTDVTNELPASFAGQWVGHLSQSDREYGFFYELNLLADGTGTSRIVSEGAGGEATHNLFWEQEGKNIYFRESEVSRRTDEQWKWCLKTAELSQSSGSSLTIEMTGNWEGYMENKDPSTGACAPGTLYLNKPVLTQVTRERLAPQTETYSANTQRSVKVDRVLRVQGKNIRIKVWDNGIVDGDVLTLFLNGTRILNEYRVNKRRWSIPVEVIEGENLLILHADDLGDISPNTVAVAIDDGVREQTVILSSNLRESGAILIQPFVRN